MKIVIVGCGNIGSRLLQSIAAINLGSAEGLEVFAIEPFAQASQTAEERYNQTLAGSPKTLSMLSDASSLDGTVDLAVIATDSKNRLAALKTLTANVKPKYLFLEKFLFQSASEYREAEALLNRHDIQAWVNCTRNEWPEYKTFKTNLAGDPVKSIEVLGGNWGLACNGIHFLALLEYLSNEAVEEITWPDRDNVMPLEAKRAGYKEITGKLEARTTSGATARLESRDADLPMSIRIVTEKGVHEISELGGNIKSTYNGETRESSFQMTHVSQLAHVFETILSDGHCELPEYTQSQALHLKTVAAMNLIFHGEADSELICPVT